MILGRGPGCFTGAVYVVKIRMIDNDLEPSVFVKSLDSTLIRLLLSFKATGLSTPYLYWRSRC